MYVIIAMGFLKKLQEKFDWFLKYLITSSIHMKN